MSRPRRKPVLLSPPGLTRPEADSLAVAPEPPRALVRALAAILARLTEKESPCAESGDTLFVDPDDGEINVAFE